MRTALQRTFTHPEFWAAMIILLWMAVAIAFLPSYGLSWDEGLGNLFFGERYARFFVTLDPAYLDFENSALGIHNRQLNLFESAYRQPHEFPPVADTVSAAFMELLAHGLNWIDPVDAFHLPKILLSGLLLWVLFWFARPRLGTFGAAVAVIGLGLHPRWWGDMFFNPKDIPVAAMITFTLIAFWHWYHRPNWKMALATGVLAGLALSIKANAVFMPVVIVLGIWPWGRGAAFWKPPLAHLRRQWRAYLLMVASALAVHFLSWPYLYANPLRLWEYYRYILGQGERSGSGAWNLDPLVQAVTTMPEVLLLLVIGGIVLAVRRVVRGEEQPFARLLLAWLSVPLLRASLPSAVNFDGIRHFLEFLPAACLLAGLAANELTEIFNFFREVEDLKEMHRRFVQIGIAGLLLVNLGLIQARYQPYSYIYYNSLVGGLAGAQERGFPEATDYWAVSYRQALGWLNENTQDQANVVAPIARWNLRLTAPLWARRGLVYQSERLVVAGLNQGKPAYVILLNRPVFDTPLAGYLRQFGRPIHTLQVAGAPVLWIYRVEPGEAGAINEYLRAHPEPQEPAP